MPLLRNQAVEVPAGRPLSMRAVRRLATAAAERGGFHVRKAVDSIQHVEEQLTIALRELLQVGGDSLPLARGRSEWLLLDWCAANGAPMPLSGSRLSNRTRINGQYGGRGGSIHES